MIIPFVQLPPVVRYSPHDSTLRHFFNYIDRLGVLGYVMLACSDRWDRKTGLFELTKVVQANAVFMCGFVVRDVEVASHLLDKGLGIAFFTLSWTDASTLDVLSPLPRSRIGVNIAATDESTIMEEITSHHGMFAHFMLRYVFTLCYVLTYTLSNPHALLQFPEGDAPERNQTINEPR